FSCESLFRSKESISMRSLLMVQWAPDGSATSLFICNMGNSIEQKPRLEKGQTQGQHPRGPGLPTPKRQRQRHTPGSNLVTCAQVCRFWSSQLLPLLWRSIRINETEQVDSIFLSSFSSRSPRPSAT